MRDWTAWLRYNLWYLRRPPWDTGTSPPELVDFIHQHPPGRALDLGCGSGTNVLSLAHAGWQVTGVDFAIKAVAQARRRLAKADLPGTIFQRDVTDLDDLRSEFDLVLDIGCYHSLPAEKKARYEANLRRLLAKQGWFLLYGKVSEENQAFGLTEADINRLAQGMRLMRRVEGIDRAIRRSMWLFYQRISAAAD